MNMINTNCELKHQIVALLVATAVFLTVTVGNADDTDIYLLTDPGEAETPLIMLSLDYRANLNSSFCSESDVQAGEAPCDVLADVLDPAIYENGNYSNLEIYVAVLEKLMEETIQPTDQNGDDVGPAIPIRKAAKFGFMMNHNDSPGGCDLDKDDGPNCSNGGFILSDFTDISDGRGNPNYEGFFNKIKQIPIPNLSWNDVTNERPNECSVYGSNTSSHLYQGAELFYEFYRFLTGHTVYSGDRGWEDFGTPIGSNLNADDDLMAVPILTDSGAVKRDGAENTGKAVCKPTPIWDESIIDLNNFYKSPLRDLDPGSCGQSIYTFNFMFGVSSQEEDSNCAILYREEDGLTGGGLLVDPNPDRGNPNNCNISSSGTAGPFGEVLKELFQIDLANDEDQYGPAGKLIPNHPGVQNVKSYFFVPTNQVNTTTDSYAEAGGSGGAIGMDLEDVDKTLEVLVDIITSILDVSTTFVPPTLPSNAFDRTDILNDVYIALFQPSKNPRWSGDLKRFKLNRDATPAFVVDANGDPAIAADPNDGRIRNTALSVWTYPADIPDPGTLAADYSVGKDGRSVVHGGAGGVIPGYRDLQGNSDEPGEINETLSTDFDTARIIYTEPDNLVNATSRPSALRAFNADDETAVAFLSISSGSIGDDYEDIKADLWQTIMPAIDCDDPANCDNYNKANTTDQAEGVTRMKNILAYGRGYKSFGGDKREWFMGDPLHSKIAAINYGGDTEDTQIVRLAISTNDGFLHFFRAEDGVEDWAFTPRSVTRIQHRLQKNTIDTAPLHPYTLDSSPVALLLDEDNNGKIETTSDDKAYLYFGMRRGGKHVYALDITDYDDPKMLWSISKDDTDFSELGQTWSDPKPIYIKYDDIETHALIFGGGFNGDDDGDNDEPGKDERDDSNNAFSGQNDDEGNAVFIVNAETGELIWKAVKGSDPSSSTEFQHSDLDDSIPSKMVVVNATSPGDPYHDRAYVGDTGGRVWRVDFNGSDRTAWKISVIANLGRHETTGDQTRDRRFFHSAEFVRTVDNSGNFDAIIIASGNRTNPLTDAVDNNLYVIKDRNTFTTVATGEPANHSKLEDLSTNCLQTGDADSCDIDAVNFDRGWYIKLENCTNETDTGSCGEKGLSKPLVLLGKIIFNSYIPKIVSTDQSSCSPNEGAGQSYLISLADATGLLPDGLLPDGSVSYDRSERLDSGGIPSNPVVVPGGPTGGGGSGGGGGGGGSSCPESVGYLNPDLVAHYICGPGLLKKYWYLTEPE